MSEKDTRLKRLKESTEEEFKKLLQERKIRPASLQDVEGLHHKRALYKHPRTGQYYVEKQICST